jgi:hypothetical protein
MLQQDLLVLEKNSTQRMPIQKRLGTTIKMVLSGELRRLRMLLVR